MTAIAKGRAFISDTSLPQKILTNWDNNIVNINLTKEYLSTYEQDTLFQSLSEKIDKEAKKITKVIKGRIEGISMDVMYLNLNDTQWYEAALIVEIFRDPAISKNAGNIDTKALQKKIYLALENENINFVIRWGQAKRYCGGLKTNGYFADFSELYSILTLYIIMKSIHLICRKKVSLTVLTGGSRFYSALFTDPEIVKEYDAQRQAIADYFSTENTSINFSAYHKSNDKINENLDTFYDMIDQVEIDKILKTVLINIDWLSIFKNHDKQYHGISIPSSLSKYIEMKGSVDLLITMAIVSIINNKTHSFWIEKINDMELFDDTIDFFYEITRESARKYLAIHLMDADIDSTLKSKSHPGAIRLTVHEKKDRKDIPAIFTLGKNGGNKLSQHVCSLITQDGISFDTTFEILHKNKTTSNGINVVMPSKDGLFNWLADGQQPFFYTDLKKEHYLEELKNLKFIEG